MGLSNEERLSGIYYSIDSMVDIVDSLKEYHEGYEFSKKLAGFVDQLWHAFLGKNHNGAHWVLGSSAGNAVTWGTASAWGIAAINHHTQKVLNTEEDPFKKSDDFDPFEHFLGLPGLLHQAGCQYKAIYEIFGWTEQAIYYLRRYDDELLKGLEPLSKLISDIQGECFKLFKRQDYYARAYILNILCKMIYGKDYPYQKEKWDAFTKFLISACGHHDLNRLMTEGELKALAELHVKMHRLEKDNKLTVMNRVEAFLILAGHKFHYDHVYKKLTADLKGLVTAKDVNKLQTLFNKCKADREKKEKDSIDSYKESRMSLLSIYDFSME